MRAMVRRSVGTGEAKEIDHAVRLAPVHGLGPSVVAVAAQHDTGRWPALPDMPDKAADMAAHLLAGGRLIASASGWASSKSRGRSGPPDQESIGVASASILARGEGCSRGPPTAFSNAR